MFVKLQPYRQTSMHQGGLKLQAKYFGPFQVIDTGGPVAYRLRLPSLLRPIRALVQAASFLSGTLITPDLFPQVILDRRRVKRHNAAAAQLLIQWQGLTLKEATWEFADKIRRRFPAFALEDKAVQGANGDANSNPHPSSGTMLQNNGH